MREAALSVPSAANVQAEQLVLSTVYFCGPEASGPCALTWRYTPPRGYAVDAGDSSLPYGNFIWDHPNAVAHVARSCGCSSWQASCLPLDKRTFIEEQRERGEIVVMLGDGVNDALALAGAHVGICVASATEVSTHVSDILLTHQGLEGVVQILHLAQKGERILLQNLFWAFFYNAIGIILAALGVLSPSLCRCRHDAQQLDCSLECSAASTYVVAGVLPWMD